MSEIARMSGEMILSGERFHVRFVRHDNRYAHIISLIESTEELGRTWPLLASVEGPDDEPWPPSPPLQGLHIDRRQPRRPVALLTGMAGAGHWSAAVTLSLAEGCEELHFDIACRSPRLPAAVGNRYRLLEGTRLQWPEAVLQAPGGSCRVLLDDTEPSCAAASATSDGFEIGPRDLDLPLPATWRWGFTLRAPAPA
jgi:hypothetical protein